MLAKLQLSIEHATWLETVRKIPCELAAEMGVVTKSGCVAFEYRQNGVASYVKGRRSDAENGKSFWIEPSGRAPCLWNEDCLSDPSDAALIITEGEFDALSFLAAGATHAVSVPNGAPAKAGEGEIVPRSDRQFAYLWRDGKLHPGLDAFAKIILATDDDAPGRILRDELAIRLGRTRCWYVTYPADCKDANDVLQKFGEECGRQLLMDMIADARPLVPSRLVKFSDIPTVRRETVTVGFHPLNPHLRVQRPELMVITGPPGDGKSQFGVALGCNLAHFHNWPGAIIQFEDDVERNREDLIRYWCGKHGIALSVDRKPTERELENAAAWIDTMFRTVSPNEELEDTAVNLEWLRSNISEAATRHGAKWVIIDPWNELEHAFAKGQTEAQYLNDAVRGLKRLARRYQLLIVIVAHPTATGGQATDIDAWSLYNVSGGAVWNNKADHGVIVLRPDKDVPVSFVKVSKSKRHATMGRPGTVRMRFNPLLATYEPL